jgi:hypothetical protein
MKHYPYHAALVKPQSTPPPQTYWTSRNLPNSRQAARCWSIVCWMAPDILNDIFSSAASLSATALTPTAIRKLGWFDWIGRSLRRSQAPSRCSSSPRCRSPAAASDCEKWFVRPHKPCVAWWRWNRASCRNSCYSLPPTKPCCIFLTSAVSGHSQVGQAPPDNSKR